MGVADNKSYKDQYHFRDDFKVTGKEYPSIHEEPKVNTSIKENPFRSNVEIEGDEIVLQPDLSALFKAVGKKHSKGGIDVLLKPESFIFSDYDGLSMSKGELDLFELKEGGKNKENTPANVLRKNIDIKHYNTMVNILNDPFKDDMAKKTAALMLEKYIATVGNIAYIQENKKDFPQGIPAFSMGTAPVYNADLKNEIMANKQYMKAGGRVRNPYMQRGGRNWSDLLGNIPPAPTPSQPIVLPQVGYTGWNPATGQYLVNGVPSAPPTQDPTQVTPPPQNTSTRRTASAPNNPWGLWQGDQMPIFQNKFGVSNRADKINDLGAVAKQLGYTGPNNNTAFQKWLYSSSPENKAIIDKWHTQYGEPNIGKPDSQRERFDGKIGIRWTNAINEIINRKPPIVATPPVSAPPTSTTQQTTLAPAGPQVPNLEVTPQGSKQADWRFTPWQKISQLYNWGQFANVKRYMPYRSRYNATYTDPALVNPEQAVGDIQAQANQQLSSIGTLNPILRNAQAAAISGQAMNAAPGVRSQYDNQNAQIINQNRQYNNQVRNNESLVNMANDQTYYQQAIEGRKNFDNMRQFTANNAMNNVLRDVETNQKLAYNLLTQNNPAYGFDWRTGNFIRNNKNIMDVQTNAVNDRYADLVELVNSISDPVEKAKLAVKLEGLKVFGSAQQSPNIFKKGGTKKKNPYK